MENSRKRFSIEPLFLSYNLHCRVNEITTPSPGSNGTLIDNIFINISEGISRVEVINSLLSDHFSQLLEIHGIPLNRTAPVSQTILFF